jgi:hypothetical protein
MRPGRRRASCSIPCSETTRVDRSEGIETVTECLRGKESEKPEKREALIQQSPLFDTCEEKTTPKRGFLSLRAGSGCLASC